MISQQDKETVARMSTFRSSKPAHCGYNAMTSSRRCSIVHRLAGIQIRTLVLAIILVQSARTIAQEWKFDSDSSSSSVVGTDLSDKLTPKVNRFRLDSPDDIQRIQLIRNLPPSLPHDEFAASAKVGANLKGVQLALRLVMPNQIDPRTSEPMFALVRGDTLDRSGVLQTLSVSGTAKTIQTALRQLRTETFEEGINTDGAYFDGCVLVAEVHQGQSFIEVSDSAYGPVVPVPDMKAAAATPIVSSHIPVQVHRDRILMGDQASYPRLLPDHGEAIAFLQRLGINAVWVSDLSNVDRMQQLIDNNIVVVATPPHPEFDPADFRVPLQGLPPLDSTHPLPSVWYLGTDVKADQMAHLLAWGREVRSADRKLPRPLMADVQALEGVASRQIDFVGISQHAIGGATSFGKARNQSYLRQNSSAHLTVPWEWIQTEIDPAVSGWRSRNGFAPVVVEPEQILMQSIAVLSSGCRGAGFWKTTGLESNEQQPSETALAIELASLHLQILEPFLIRGRVEGHIGVSTMPGQQKSKGVAGMLSVPGAQVSAYASAVVKPDGALINSQGSTVILMGYWDEVSQMVPQELYAAEATATVSATETASAWQVTATGVRGLRRQPTAGGLNLKIKDFDQTAIVLVSSNPEDRDLMEQRVHKTAERAAGLFVKLATLKLSRVRSTCADVDRIAGADNSASQLFGTAESMLAYARQALSRRDFPNAEKQARASMRQVRKIQSRYWYRAIQSLPTPMASPHGTAFSALPDHWMMIARVQQGRPEETLVPSGSFESLRQLATGSWLPVSPQEKYFQTNADIVSEGNGSNQVLRIRTWQLDDDQVGDASRPSFLIRSPEIPVEQGAVYEITGRVKLGQSVITSQTSPFSIFDSDLGPEFSVRPSLERSWRTFSILRQPSETGTIKLWMTVQGAAEIFVDDLAVRKIAAPTIRQRGPQMTDQQAPATSNQGNSSQVLGAGYSIDRKP